MSQQQAQRFIEQATYALQQGEVEQALAFADQAAALAPYSGDAQLLRGITLSQLGHPSAATEAFNRAIQLSPHDPAGYYNLALHYYNLGYRMEAAHMANEALRIDAHHAGARQLLDLLSRPPAPGEQPATVEPPAPIEQPPPADAPQSEQPTEAPQSEQAGPAEPVQPTGGRPGPDAPYGTGPIPPTAQPGPSAPYQPPPSGYGYQPPPPPRGVPFVRSLGSAWDVAAYLLILTGLVVFFVILANYWYVVMEGPAAVSQQATRPAQLLFMGVSGLSCLWMMLDISDKQTSPLWLIPAILCCCCPGDWFFLALYLAVGRKA